MRSPLRLSSAITALYRRRLEAAGAGERAAEAEVAAAVARWPETRGEGGGWGGQLVVEEPLQGQTLAMSLVHGVFVTFRLSRPRVHEGQGRGGVESWGGHAAEELQAGAMVVVMVDGHVAHLAEVHWGGGSRRVEVEGLSLGEHTLHLALVDNATGVIGAFVLCLPVPAVNPYIHLTLAHPDLTSNVMTYTGLSHLWTTRGIHACRERHSKSPQVGRNWCAPGGRANGFKDGFVSDRGPLVFQELRRPRGLR